MEKNKNLLGIVNYSISQVSFLHIPQASIAFILVLLYLNV